MSETLERPTSGLVKDWLLNHLMPWLMSSRLVAGAGIKLERGSGGTLISMPATDIDLAGVLHGPYQAGAGRYVLADLTAGTCAQQSLDAVRPDVPPQNEVWIDLSKTIGRVYLPRVG